MGQISLGLFLVLAVFCMAYRRCFGFRYGSRVDVASDDIVDALYRVCLERCGGNGCVGHTCFKQCNYSSSSVEARRPWCRQQPAYIDWNHWVCASECRYHCTASVDHQIQLLGFKPHKFQRKWAANPFHGIQEPVPAALSGVALAMHFHGWVSFVIHVNYKLPLRLDKKKKTTYYEYTGLWHIYALLAMNGWLWAGAFHCRDVELTEKLDSISCVVLLSYTVFLAIVRSFGVKDTVMRVMVAAPVFAFAATHILYMNLYKFDHRLDTVVCMIMYATHVTFWSVLVGVSRHPSRWKMWSVALGGGIPMLIMRIYDCPPYWGFLDMHSVWHAIMIPLIYVWWDFIRDDTEFEFRTRLLLVSKKK